MSRTTTRFKYLAIGVQIFVIILSLLILISLYIYSIGIDLKSSNTFQQTSSDGNVSSVNEQDQINHFDHLPSFFLDIINWLGQSVTLANSNHHGNRVEEVIGNNQEDNLDNNNLTSHNTTLLFEAGRPLIAVCFLSYVLAIISAVAIGLEHQTILALLAIIYAIVFTSSLTTLVFSMLTPIFDNSLTIQFDFWTSLLLLIVGVSGLEFYTTTYLVCFIYFERYRERTHEYCLAKMVNDL